MIRVGNVEERDLMERTSRLVQVVIDAKLNVNTFRPTSGKDRIWPISNLHFLLPDSVDRVNSQTAIAWDEKW